MIQMINRNIIGKPVLPMMMKNIMKISGYGAVSKETIESAVKDRPKLLNALIAVKNPHQVGETPFRLIISE